MEGKQSSWLVECVADVTSVSPGETAAGNIQQVDTTTPCAGMNMTLGKHRNIPIPTMAYTEREILIAIDYQCPERDADSESLLILTLAFHSLRAPEWLACAQ